MSTSQLSLEIPTVFRQDIYAYGQRTSGETHGVVLTRPHIVELILDLAGYTDDCDLGEKRLLDPSCGHGAFVIEAIARLLRSARKFSRDPSALGRCIRALDIDQDHLATARQAAIDLLCQNDVDEWEATALADQWFVAGDFLLAPAEPFDFVVGNPPYVRIEQISPELQAEYRQRFSTLYDRADLYVAFIEKSLRLLHPEGVLALICADRWILNKYGSALRRLLTREFRLQYYIDLHRSSPFESEVIAYPSIFVLRPGTTDRVRVASMQTANPEECRQLLATLRGSDEKSTVSVSTYDSWFEGDEPWIISTPEHLRALRELESRFEPLESHGTRIGIGVATGNDSIFIVDRDADIEADRLVPLVRREDIAGGQIRDAGRCVINCFSATGQTVDLNAYPRLSTYLGIHGDAIRRRHVARKNPGNWFRTIDRVYPELVAQPKLLIPDIAGSNQVTFDSGRFYPHHNLYFVTSQRWDLEILGGLLSSRVALFFVWCYAVKMRGGYLRFQAQYLRRIRIPAPESLSRELSDSIRGAFRERDFQQLDTLALAAYRIDPLPEFPFTDTRR